MIKTIIQSIVALGCCIFAFYNDGVAIFGTTIMLSWILITGVVILLVLTVEYNTNKSSDPTVRVNISYPFSGTVGSSGLHIFTGPMGSGKTTELIRRVNILKTKRTVLCICHEKDSDRKAKQISKECGVIPLSSKDETATTTTTTTTTTTNTSANLGKRIQNHNGIWTEAIPVGSLELSSILSRKEYIDASVVAIDEGQFFSGIVEFIIAAIIDGKYIMISTLDSDSDGRTYFPFDKVIPFATSITKFNGMCRFCDRDSIQTIATFQKNETNVVGGMEMYAPVCLLHAAEKRKSKVFF